MLQTISRNRWGILAILSVTFAAAYVPIPIKNAQELGIPSLTIIAYRLLITSVVLIPIAWHRHSAEYNALSRRDWGIAMAAGFFHAMGLVFLFFSLENTSVFINSALRRTSPMFVLGLEAMFLHAIFSRRAIFGIFLAVVGAAVVGMSGGEVGLTGKNDTLGAIYAVGNAVMISFYLLIGRQIRTKLSFLPYSTVVFATAAVFAMLFVWIQGEPLLGFSAEGWILIVAITIIAQFLGHIPINVALSYYPATIVSVLLLFSVALAAIFAYFLLEELPTAGQLWGSLVLLIGIFLVTMVPAVSRERSS